MSKELEALERIKKFYPTWRLSNREAFNLVESALKRLNYIDENKIYCINENYLQDIKKIKAFEIIKHEHTICVDCDGNFYTIKCSQKEELPCNIKDVFGVKECHRLCKMCNPLPKEKNDLLREVLQ